MPSEDIIELFTRGLFEPETLDVDSLNQILREFGVSFEMYIRLIHQVQSEIACYKHCHTQESHPQLPLQR